MRSMRKRHLTITPAILLELILATCLFGVGSALALGHSASGTDRYGATGATTLVYSGNRWNLLGLDHTIEDNILESLSDLDPDENDVVVIGTSSDYLTAAIGSFAAALDLLS